MPDDSEIRRAEAEVARRHAEEARRAEAERAQRERELREAQKGMHGDDDRRKRPEGSDHE